MNDGRDGLSLDELHGVVMDAPLTADAMDRHDMLVVQVASGLGLVYKALELTGVQGRRERQDLQGHTPVEGELFGFIDDTHAAPSDLAEQAEVAKRRCQVGVRV